MIARLSQASFSSFAMGCAGDAPADYGPHKTLYNRFVRWSRMGVFDRIFAGLAAQGDEPDEVMIDATHLKAHRTAASLLKGGCFPGVSGEPKAA